MKDVLVKDGKNRLVLQSCRLGSPEDRYFYKSFDDKLLVGTNSANLLAITMEGEVAKGNTAIVFKLAAIQLLRNGRLKM